MIVYIWLVHPSYSHLGNGVDVMAQDNDVDDHSWDELCLGLWGFDLVDKVPEVLRCTNCSRFETFGIRDVFGQSLQ